MQPRIIFALLALAAGAPSASATVVGLDTVLVGNPNIIAGDAFNNGIFDAPPWFVVSGSPGPEAGETLTMHNGDFIYLGLSINPFNNTSAFSQMHLTDFPAGSFASMILFGDEAGELLTLGVAPGFAILTNGTGAILGSAPLPASSDANLLLTVNPSGPVFASINDVTVFDGSLTFGPVTAIGINVVPEPATLGLLGLGCVFMGVRRRLRRPRA